MSRNLVICGERFRRLPNSYARHVCDVCGKTCRCDFWENCDPMHSVTGFGRDICRDCAESWPEKTEVSV